MSGDLFRPRRRPLLRLAIVVGASALVCSAVGTVIWLRRNVVPPGCADHDTLALVHRSLTGRFKLPESVSIEGIETHSGGYLAFRFTCEADLGNINPDDLPPGTAIPGKVYYVSRLTRDHLRHEVTVRIYPLLKLEKVQ